MEASTNTMVACGAIACAHWISRLISNAHPASVLRAAAKNFQDVVVVTSPGDYSTVADALKSGKGILQREFLFDLARKAFLCTARYDSQIAQYLSINGRDASVGDVISNSLGGAFGFAAAHYARHWLLPSRRAAINLALVWGGFWILIQLGSSYALAPSLPPTRYYGQVAREFENLATFKGSVISPTIGNTTVPDYGFAKTAEFRHNLARGESVSAIVVPAGPTPKLAPIIRVADDRRQEIVLLAQLHRDLVFGLRTGASVLRLRGPLFILRDVFPTGSEDSSASDTLRLSGRYDAKLVEMRATNRRESRDRALAVDPGLAWALILPCQWYFAGTTLEWILTRIWMALLLLPLGYWLAFASATGVPGASRAGLLGALGAILLLWVGFAALPPHFGIPRASLASWVTAVAGLLIGVAIALAAGAPSLHQH